MNIMRSGVLACAVALASVAVAYPQNHTIKTYANPINLDYRFESTYREAADPVVVNYRGEYYLFATNGQGYWWSPDLLRWTHTTADVPAVGASTAPAAMVYKGALYYLPASWAQTPGVIYRSVDPKHGKWEIFNPTLLLSGWDPALFVDDDDRVYFYWGCTNSGPISAIELDAANGFNPIGEPVDLVRADKAEHGWERTGDYNQEEDGLPWNEGAWMTKHRGRYYLQYAVPGTEFKSYSDGVWVSDQPLGPFHPAAHNPFSSKPEGFLAGAGHGSTVQDIYGNIWHVASMKLSLRARFERRLGLWPVFFDADGEMYAYTGFGDYPMMIPDRKVSSPDELFPGWMLLSYRKPGHASSTTDAFPVANAFDENGASYWAAMTGDRGEWLSVDLQTRARINAVQISLIEHTPQSTVADMVADRALFTQPVQQTPTGLIKALASASPPQPAPALSVAPDGPRQGSTYHQYLLEYSDDNRHWKVLIDKRNNKTDVPYDYVQLEKPVRARYLKLTNYHVPELPNAKFAVAGFRVFGSALGRKPAKVAAFTVRRQTDRRNVDLRWTPSPGATGYNIRFGIWPNKLYHNYIVYSDTSLTIHSLSRSPAYYFAIDAFNESGITRGTTAKMVK